MKTSVKVCTVIALLLFIVAGLGWWRAQETRRFARLLASPVFEMPIRFEDGFSFTSSFTVAFATNYQVVVAFQRTNSDAIAEISHEIPIKFTITCNGTSVAQGDSPGMLGGGSSAVEDHRTLASFNAELGKTYNISFHAVSTLSSLADTKPAVRVRVPLAALKGLMIRALELTWLAIGLAVAGAVFALPACIFFLRRRVGPEIRSA